MIQENQENEKKKEKEKKTAAEVVDPLGCIQDLLEEEQDIQIKTIDISNGDTDLKTFLLKIYLEKMKKHFIDTIEELKGTRSS